MRRIFPASTRRLSLVLSLAFLLSLSLLASSSREAWAAVPAPGRQAFVDTSGASLAITCTAAPCTYPITVTWTTGRTTGVLPGTDCRARTSPTDPYPASIPSDVYPGARAIDPGAIPAGTAFSGQPSTDTATSKTWADITLTAQRFVWVTCYTARPTHPLLLTAVWDLDYVEPAATTTPTTTAPSTTSPPPSTGEPTEPTATTSPAPGGTSSTVCGSTEAAPCFVHQVNAVPVDVGSITVSALTEGQWSELLLALGALTFFSAASFVSGWRRGRRS